MPKIDLRITSLNAYPSLVDIIIFKFIKYNINNSNSDKKNKIRNFKKFTFLGCNSCFSPFLICMQSDIVIRQMKLNVAIIIKIHANSKSLLIFFLTYLLQDKKKILII